MAATTKLSATFSFDDGRESFKYELEPYATDAEVISSFKANVIEFNESTDTNITTTKANMISNGGYSCTGISAAFIETTNKVYYSLT